MPAFTFEVGYAKNARAACKHCKEKIEKDAFRIGVKMVVDVEGAGAVERQKAHMMEAMKWHHAGCLSKFKGAAWFRQHLTEEADSYTGFDTLEEADKQKVISIFKLCKGEDVEVEASEAGGKRKSGAGSTKSSKKAKVSEEPETGSSALTPEQQSSIDATKAELSKKSVAALGSMLQMNGLPKSGRKDELLDRAAEAKVLGVPPVCPACDKAKLRWSKVTGNYSCPGFFDDEAGRHKRCKGPDGDAAASLVRTDWKELAMLGA